MRDMFTWFLLHKDSIAWKTFHDSQILWLCCSGHCPPTAGRQGCLCCLERFHIRLLVWSLKIRPSMLENVCLNLENTFPKLPTVVTCSVKMQETLQLLTRKVFDIELKKQWLQAPADRHRLNQLKRSSFLCCTEYQLEQQDRECLCDRNNLQQLGKSSSETQFSETLPKRFQEPVLEKGLSETDCITTVDAECARNRPRYTQRNYWILKHSLASNTPSL